MKIIVTLVLSLLFFFLHNTNVFAQVNITPEICNQYLSGGSLSSDAPAVCKDILASQANDTNPIYGPDGVLTRAINIISIVVGIVSVIVIIIAGIRMSLSQGDSNKIASSRSQIIYAVIGIVVAVLAQSVVRLILVRL